VDGTAGAGGRRPAYTKLGPAAGRHEGDQNNAKDKTGKKLIADHCDILLTFVWARLPQS
jgi:hypothetical protein